MKLALKYLRYSKKNQRPITMRATRQVASILKHVGTEYEPYYRYYM